MGRGSVCVYVGWAGVGGGGAEVLDSSMIAWWLVFE